MIVISGITISNPSGNLNSVVIQILDELYNNITTIPYSGQSIIEFLEPSGGTYNVNIFDGTSTETCEVNKSIIITIEDPTMFGTGFNNTVMCIVQLLPNNEYIVGGFYSSYDGTTVNRIIKLNQDGSIDGTFNSGSGFLHLNGEYSTIYSIINDLDGNYVIGGRFRTYDGADNFNLIKINSYGIKDSTFGILGTDGIRCDFFGDGSFYAEINKIIQDSNGKYLIGGKFISYGAQSNDVNVNNIIRLNTNGTVDDSFGFGDGFTNNNPIYEHIYTFIEDSNNKYLIGGRYDKYNNTTANNIIRLNQDGSIDNTFNPGGGFNGIVYSIIENADNKYLIGGSFTSYSGTTSNRIIRLNQDGSIDNVFNIGTGFNNFVYVVVLDSNGKYVIGGSFTSYSGTTSNRIIRLNQDGSIDNTFNSGSGFNGIVYSIIENTNNKYLIGGIFTTYNGTTSNRIIRLNQDGSILI